MKFLIRCNNRKFRVNKNHVGPHNKIFFLSPRIASSVQFRYTSLFVHDVIQIILCSKDVIVL